METLHRNAIYRGMEGEVKDDDFVIIGDVDEARCAARSLREYCATVGRIPRNQPDTSKPDASKPETSKPETSNWKLPNRKLPTGNFQLETSDRNQPDPTGAKEKGTVRLRRAAAVVEAEVVER